MTAETAADSAPVRAVASRRPRKYWGWGYADEGPTAGEREQLRGAITALLGRTPEDRPAPPPPAALALPPMRLDAADVPIDAAASPAERVLHAAGKSYAELFRLRRGVVRSAPDVVAYPAGPHDLLALLEWADRRGAAVVPFGGGSSVTGGVEPRVSARYAGTVSVDMARMRRIIEVDPVSRLVHAEAGVFGPDLDAALSDHDLTIRHYPQSYYQSTVGGWIATRSGGHFSTLFGKIDDRVAGLEIVAPNGMVGATRVLPQGSIGPDPNRLWIGSEGTLGVITKAWLRVFARPKFKRAGSVDFPGMPPALEAARSIVHSGLYPAQLRILDPYEAMISRAVAGESAGAASAVLLIGFESGGHPVETLLADAVRIAKHHGGRPQPPPDRNQRDDESERWRRTFFRQPYLRDLMIEWGLVVDTFETAVPWNLAESFYATVRGETLAALAEVCGAGAVLCRTTHAYSDGIAYYFTFIGPGRPGDELEQYARIKTAATDAVVRAGGTASHHHACGRDHVPWVNDELPAIWRRALLGAKQALDPQGLMNPGVIFSESAGSYRDAGQTAAANKTQ